MALDSVIRNVAIKLADKATKPLQVSVTHHVWKSQTDTGEVTYKSPVIRKALVDNTQRIVRTQEGQLVQASASITFLTPVEIGLLDSLVLPNGYSGPILNVGGFLDPKTGRGYFAEVYLG